MPSFSEVPSKIQVAQFLTDWDEGEDWALGRLAPVVEPEALTMSFVTVKRNWKFSNAWLLRAMSGENGDGY